MFAITAAIDPSSTQTIAEGNKRRQPPARSDELLTLVQAAAELTRVSGVRITYTDLRNRFFQRVRRPPIKLLERHLGRKLHGKRVPTYCIRTADLPKLAQHMGIRLDPEATHP